MAKSDVEQALENARMRAEMARTRFPGMVEVPPIGDTTTGGADPYLDLVKSGAAALPATGPARPAPAPPPAPPPKPSLETASFEDLLAEVERRKEIEAKKAAAEEMLKDVPTEYLEIELARRKS